MRLTATLAAGLITATATLLPTAPAEAQHYRHGYYGGGYHGGGYHAYRRNYGYRSYGYRYRQPYRGYGFNRFHGGYGYHGGGRGGRLACRRFYYHHRYVRSCRRVFY